MKSFEELNALLIDKCIAWAKANPHPEMTDRTVWEVFEAERPQLVPYAGRFDGFHSVPAAVSKTCLVRFDNNKYSVMASAVGRPVEIRAYAERIEIRQGEPSRRHRFEPDGERGSSVTIPAALAGGGPSTIRGIMCRSSFASPGRCAVSHGAATGPRPMANAPFKDWVLPGALEKVRRKLKGVDDGDRQPNGECSIRLSANGWSTSSPPC